MSAASTWIRVAAGNIPLREGRAVTIGNRAIAVFNVGNDRFLAVDGRCPHKGGPLCDGIVAGDTVVCPLHAWKIELASGRVERPSGIAACVNTYETRVEDGFVMIRLEANDKGQATTDKAQGTKDQGQGTRDKALGREESARFDADDDPAVVLGAHREDPRLLFG
jgi:nitrite reductase (NADH) small subunit